MKAALFILAIFISCSALAGNETKVDSLKKLGRDSLIKLAIKKINDPQFNSANYDQIIVKANKNELLVVFNLQVEVKTKKACYYNSLSVSLLGSGNSKSIIGDCDNPSYYTAPESDKKKIKFVFDAINKSDEVGHVKDNKLPSGTTMNITEHSTYYFVETSSWSTYSYFKVDKLSGKISDAGHKHYAHSGNENSEWEIIE